MPDPIGFTGQAIVVTGAGRGLGRLYALDSPDRREVLVNDVGASMNGAVPMLLLPTASSRRFKQPGGTPSHRMTLSTPPKVAKRSSRRAQLLRPARCGCEKRGHLRDAAIEDLSAQQWRRMFQVHLDGTFYLCHPAFRFMKEQGYGRLVLVASNIGGFRKSMPCTTERQRAASSG